MTTIFLTAHIAGAFVTGISILYALWLLVKPDTAKNKKALGLLGSMSVFQVVSGALLSATADESTLAFCTKIGVYLGIIIAVQVALMLKQQNHSLRPLVYTYGLNTLIIGLYVLMI